MFSSPSDNDVNDAAVTVAGNGIGAGLLSGRFGPYAFDSPTYPPKLIKSILQITCPHGSATTFGGSMCSSKQIGH